MTSTHPTSGDIANHTAQDDRRRIEKLESKIHAPPMNDIHTRIALMESRIAELEKHPRKFPERENVVDASKQEVQWLMDNILKAMDAEEKWVKENKSTVLVENIFYPVLKGKYILYDNTWHKINDVDFDYKSNKVILICDGLTFKQWIFEPFELLGKLPPNTL